VKSTKKFVWARFGGLILMHFSIYFNIKASGGSYEPWELVKYMSFGYSPVFAYILFSLYRLLKLKSASSRESG
jgi:hypothetical protein